MTLGSATLGVTLLLTLGAFLVLLSSLGPAALLYVAMLATVVPGLLAQTIPPGLLGGTLLSHSTADATWRSTVPDVLKATIVLTLVTLYLTGWLAPLAFERTGAAVDRFHDQPVVERQAPAPPVARPLPELVRDASEPARTELWRRLQLVALCAAFGFAAAAVVGSGVRMNTPTVVGITAVAFIWQMHRWIEAG
jgi:lipopolysaccharide export LptBFGC system permease protein LptF